MTKELPWFKFTPSKWDNGNIQLCSFEQKGVFVEVCSMYWQRLGELPYKLAVQKICGGNATALDSLCEAGIIKVIEGMICIDFLNEQLSEFENVSVVNSENARLGWEKRRKNATAMRPHSEINATPMPVEKRRVEKREREEETKIIQEVSKILNYSSPNTSALSSTVQIWINEGHKDIPKQLRAMKVYYARQTLVFPTRLETLTDSFARANWVEKLKELDPEKQAENFQKTLKDGKHEQQPDLIGSSTPGSLG